MIKLFDKDKAGAFAYLDEKKIESITFEEESFFEPNIEVVYWNKLENKFFLFLKKESVAVKMDSGSKFYFILEKKDKNEKFAEKILVSKQTGIDYNVFLGKNEVLKNGMLILNEYDCNIFNETDVIEITVENLNKFSNDFRKNIAKAILEFEKMDPKERTPERLNWLSSFLRKNKGVEEQKINKNVSVLKISI